MAGNHQGALYEMILDTRSRTLDFSLDGSFLGRLEAHSTPFLAHPWTLVTHPNGTPSWEGRRRDRGRSAADAGGECVSACFPRDSGGSLGGGVEHTAMCVLCQSCAMLCRGGAEPPVGVEPEPERL